MLELLKKYLPSFVSFIQRDVRLEAKLNDFKVRHQNLLQKLRNEGDSIVRPHSIYEWIVTAEQGDLESMAFLNFLDQTLLFATREIEMRLNAKLRSIAWHLVTAFDTDVTLKENPRYLTYLGELLVIHRILTDKVKFQLLEIEHPLPNQKTADIFILNLQSKEKVLFDVFSLLGFDPSKPETENDVVNFFERKFNQKLGSKTDGLDEAESGTEIIINGEQVRFAILPILWIELQELVRWRDVLSAIEKKYKNVLPLSILFAQQSIDGSFTFTFSNVSIGLETI